MLFSTKQIIEQIQFLKKFPFFLATLVVINRLTSLLLGVCFFLSLPPCNFTCTTDLPGIVQFDLDEDDSAHHPPY